MGWLAYVIITTVNTLSSNMCPAIHYLHTKWAATLVLESNKLSPKGLGPDSYYKTRWSRDSLSLIYCNSCAGNMACLYWNTPLNIGKPLYHLWVRFFTKIWPYEAWHWHQRKPLVSDPGLPRCTCVTHVPWWMSGLLTRDGGENIPIIRGACATRNFTYLARGYR